MSFGIRIFGNPTMKDYKNISFWATCGEYMGPYWRNPGSVLSSSPTGYKVRELHYKGSTYWSTWLNSFNASAITTTGSAWMISCLPDLNFFCRNVFYILVHQNIVQPVKDKKAKFSLAARNLRTDFPVDNLLSGADTRQEEKDLIKQITEMLRSWGFSLHKWASNDPSLLNEVPEGAIARDQSETTES